MRVTTRVVIDIETGRVLKRESYAYSGPWMLAKKKKKGIGERAEAISAQERAARDLELGKSEPSLSFFERSGSDEMSPLQQSLLRLKQRGITGAYRGEKAATRARGAMAGYGYEQPIFQGAEEEVGAQEASELGRHQVRHCSKPPGRSCRLQACERVEPGFTVRCRISPKRQKSNGKSSASEERSGAAWSGQALQSQVAA